MVAKFRWKSSDLELLPEDGKRYEIVDGELLVTHAPHWGHQRTCGRLFSALDNWSNGEWGGRSRHRFKRSFY